MRRLKKRQIFICILVSFLICGLIGYSLLPTSIKPFKAASFSFTFSEKTPLHDSESYPLSLPIPQVTEGNGIFAQIVAGTNSYRVPTKSTGNVRSALCYCDHNTDSSHAEISPCIIDSPNTVFKFTNGQTYQRLDIPPPHTSASL
jgi:hypothetical protein